MEDNRSACGSAALLRDLAAGDPGAAKAWTHLVERHGARLWEICWRVTGERLLAEEACQEAWLQVRICAGQFRGGGEDADAAARGWLAQVAARCALLLLRRRTRARRHERVLDDGPEPPVTGTEKDAPAAEAHGLVSHALATLRAQDRIPLQLHYLGGFTHHQLAATLGCTRVAARVRVHRALVRLREQLGRSGVALGLAALAGQVQAADAVPPLPSGALHYWQGLVTSSLKPTLAASGLLTGITAMITLSFASVAAAAVLVFAVVHRTGAVERPSGVTATADANTVKTLPIPSGDRQKAVTDGHDHADLRGGVTTVPSSRPVPSRSSDGTSTLAQGEPTWVAQLRDRLAQRITFEFADQAFNDIVPFLRQVTGTTFIIAPNVYEGGGPGSVTLRVKDMPLGDALKQILEPNGLHMVLQNQAVYIFKAPIAQGMGTFPISANG